MSGNLIQHTSQGQFRKDNGQRHGIVRLIFNNNDIIEAFYAKDGRSGFGRKLYSNGDYYVGNLLLNAESGPGKLFNSSGKSMAEGYFQRGQVLSSDRSSQFDNTGNFAIDEDVV